MVAKPIFEFMAEYYEQYSHAPAPLKGKGFSN
jgi:hypothetical protein